MAATNTNLVILGTVGALTFSLLSTKTIQYFVGVGFFTIAFLLVQAVTKDLNISMLVGLLSGMFIANFFKWVLSNDICSAIFLIFIATIGVLLLIALIASLRFQNLNLNSGLGIPVNKFKGLPRPNISFTQLHQALKNIR